MSETWGIWMAGLLTAMIFSYVLGDNKGFELAEHLFIGSGAGHAITMAYINIRDSAWGPLTGGRLTLLIPIVLGILLFSRFFKGYSYLARWGVAVMVGIGTGVLLAGLPAAQVIGQIRASLLPLNSVSNAIIVFGILGVILYFMFTIKGNRGTNVLSTFGRWTMMVCFGVAFGQAVAQRTSQGAGAIQNILAIFGR